MNRTELGLRLKSPAEIRGTFKLRSGQTTDLYFDKYRFESRPEVLTAVAAALCDLLPGSIDKLAGLEIGGIPIATAMSIQSGIPSLFVRKLAKQYGTANVIEGGFASGERVVIVEDVVTTGGAIKDAVAAIRGVGLVVEHVVVHCPATGWACCGRIRVTSSRSARGAAV